MWKRFLDILFPTKAVSVGKRNLAEGMIVRRDGWTKNSYNAWINKTTILSYRSGFYK